MDDLHTKILSDAELLSYALDGEELPAPAREHLEQCEICQQRLAGYQQANTFLISQLYRGECPSGTKLSYYCAGGLSGDERISIARHLLECPLCAQEAAETRRFLQMQDLELPVQSFSPRAAVPRIFATLIRQQAQLVLRGDASKAKWPRQYRAESIDLSLHLSRTSSGENMLLGILTSDNPSQTVEAFEGVLVELYPSATRPFVAEAEKQAEKPLLSTTVDDLGNIVFNGVPAGQYVLVVHLAGYDFIVDDLAIEHT